MPQYNLAALFKVARHGNKIYVHRQIIGLGRACTYTQQNTTQPKNKKQNKTKQKKNKTNNVIRIHIDGTRNSYTKQNMSKTDRVIPWDTPSLWNLANDTNEPFHRK